MFKRRCSKLTAISVEVERELNSTSSKEARAHLPMIKKQEYIALLNVLHIFLTLWKEEIVRTISEYLVLIKPSLGLKLTNFSLIALDYRLFQDPWQPKLTST